MQKKSGRCNRLWVETASKVSVVTLKQSEVVSRSTIALARLNAGGAFLVPNTLTRWTSCKPKNTRPTHERQIMEQIELIEETEVSGKQLYLIMGAKQQLVIADQWYQLPWSIELQFRSKKRPHGRETSENIHLLEKNMVASGSVHEQYRSCGTILLRGCDGRNKRILGETGIWMGSLADLRYAIAPEPLVIEREILRHLTRDGRVDPRRDPDGKIQKKFILGNTNEGYMGKSR